MPSLLHGREACPLVKSELASLDFVVNRFFMKTFGTSNMDDDDDDERMNFNVA